MQWIQLEGAEAEGMVDGGASSSSSVPRLLEGEQSFNWLIGFILFLRGFILFLRWGLVIQPSFPDTGITGMIHHGWPCSDLEVHLR